MAYSYAAKRRKTVRKPVARTRYVRKSKITPAFRPRAYPSRPELQNLPPHKRYVIHPNYYLGTAALTGAGLLTARVSTASQYGHALRIPVGEHMTGRGCFVSGLEIRPRFELASMAGCRFTIDVLKVPTNVVPVHFPILNDAAEWEQQFGWYDGVRGDAGRPFLTDVGTWCDVNLHVPF